MRNPAAFAIACSILLSACGGGTGSVAPSAIPQSVKGNQIQSLAQTDLTACTWRIVPAANAGTDFGDFNSLNAVVARSASDAWAAGTFYDYSHSLYHALTEHYDGTQWKIVPSLDAGTRQSELNGIAAAGPHELWAVGYDQDNKFGAAYLSLLERWNGTAWSIVQSDTHIGYLSSVAATGPNDVWAVGTTNFPGQGVIEHWNGSTLSYTALPQTAYFRAITAISPNDIWCSRTAYRYPSLYRQHANVSLRRLKVDTDSQSESAAWEAGRSELVDRRFRNLAQRYMGVRRDAQYGLWNSRSAADRALGRAHLDRREDSVSRRIARIQLGMGRCRREPKQCVGCWTGRYQYIPDPHRTLERVIMVVDNYACSNKRRFAGGSARRRRRMGDGQYGCEAIRHGRTRRGLQIALTAPEAPT